MTLSFIQIYYDDIQKEEIYPFAQPYKNYGLTPFFENAVIAELVPTSNADLISVCSWRLRDKRNSSSSPIVLKGDVSLDEDKILSRDFDVAILTPKSTTHKMLYVAEQWHGKAWIEAFTELKKFLLERFGLRLKGELKHPIYENHFIAKREIYHAYVNEYLKPVMDFMDGKAVFLAPSGYYKRKRASPEEMGRIKRLLGFEDYPIMPFILERLFSIYINDKNLNVINL